MKVSNTINAVYINPMKAVKEAMLKISFTTLHFSLLELSKTSAVKQMSTNDFIMKIFIETVCN